MNPFPALPTTPPRQLSRRATEAARRAKKSQRFPKGPTFSVEFHIRWDANFFLQFENWACPWRCGVYGYGSGWLWMGSLFHMSSYTPTQPIVQHSPHIEFGSVSDYAAVVDVINGPFPAEDSDGTIYSVDHDPVVDAGTVEGGGVIPHQIRFFSWHGSATV